MAEYLDREHFIPLRKNDLMDLLLRDKQLPAQEREPFRQFCRLVSATFHFEYLAKLEELKDAYAPFDPDADTKACKPLHAEERKERGDKVFADFGALMERANFKQLKREEIEQALKLKPSDWGFHLELDLNSVFERLEMYVRGDVVREQSRRSWRTLWRRDKYLVPTHQRLALILKLRPNRRLDPNLDVNRIYFKVFKEVPKTDVDMQLPCGRPRMTRLDKAMIFYPLVFGLGALGYHVYTQFFGNGLSNFDIKAVATSVATLSVAVGLCSYAYKSLHAYQTKRQTYVLQLVRSLYFKAVGSNAAALMRLFDEAEEQECRETYLAYFCLWRFAPPQGWTAPQLDDYVEMYLEGAAGLKVDFEIGDALAKLERMHIVKQSGDHYRAVPLEKALEMLDWTWDNYFKYNPNSPEPPV